MMVMGGECEGWEILYARCFSWFWGLRELGIWFLLTLSRNVISASQYDLLRRVVCLTSEDVCWRRTGLGFS